MMRDVLANNLLDVQGKSSGRQRRNVCKRGICAVSKGRRCLPIWICSLDSVWQLGMKNSTYCTVFNAFVLSSSDA